MRPAASQSAGRRREILEKTRGTIGARPLVMANVAWAGQGVASPLGPTTGLVGPTDASAAERAARAGADLSLGRSNPFLPFGNRTGAASSLISTPALDALGTHSPEARARAATTCQRPPEVVGCASCDGAKKRPVRAPWNSPLLRFGGWLQHHKMNREEKYIQRRLDALMRKREAGEHLSEADREFLKHVSAKSSKALISLAAGVGVIEKGPHGGGGVPFGGHIYHETNLELTSEDGATVRDELGMEWKPTPGTKIKARSSTPGGKDERNIQFDRALGHRGPVHFESFREFSPEHDNGGTGLKARIGGSLPGPRGSALEGEVYAQARLNILNHEERQAVIARELMASDDYQSFQERRDAGRAEALQASRDEREKRFAANEEKRNQQMARRDEENANERQRRQEATVADRTIASE